VLRQAQHRRFLGIMGMCGVIASLSACSSPEEKKAAEPPPSGTIAPGTYSNVADEGEAEGWRVTLARGEASNAATVTYCAPECGTPISVPLRMGMGGLMAEYQSVDGRRIPLAIRPHGTGIEVAADWGDGLESHKLARVP
jgi:hypothetical protein